MDKFARYICQIALPGFGSTAQEKLQHARVLIAGAGGLGCPVAQYLVAAGIGHICLVDDDIISISNLHRQILYTANETGQKKAITAAKKLQLQNSDIEITGHDMHITSHNVMSLVQEYDIVVDTTDNIETKYLLNDACVLTSKPCVYGAVYQYEGQVAVWNVKNEDGTYSPNYRDVFPDIDASALPNCAYGGVIPTLTGIVGCTQANEVIKYITGIGEQLKSKLFIIDATTMQTRSIKLAAQSKTSIIAIKDTIPQITVAELKNALIHDRFMLIDVRTVEEHENFNIGGLHIPLASIHEQFDMLNDKPIVCYCASGRRSSEAANIIRQKFPDAVVYSLAGGLNKWNE